MALAIHGREEGKTGFAVLLVIIAFATFAGVDASARWLTREAGYAPMEAAFVRYAGHLALIVALILPQHGLSLFRTQRPRDEVLRGLFLLSSTLCNFVALSHLPMSLTGSIFFATPLIVCLLSIPLLGERVGPRRWAAVIIGFIGVMLVMQPWSEAFHWAIFFSLGAAAGAALYLIWTRRLAGVDATDTQQFYTALVATAALAPFALPGLRLPSEPIDWLPFLCIGFFGWAGHQCATIAHRFAEASVLAPLFYIQLVFLSLVDFLIFAVAPDPWLAPGVLVVAGAGLFIWLRERALSREAGHGR